MLGGGRGLGTNCLEEEGIGSSEKKERPDEGKDLGARRPRAGRYYAHEPGDSAYSTNAAQVGVVELPITATRSCV